MMKSIYTFWASVPKVTKAIFWALLATVFMTAMSVLIKYLGSSLPFVEVAWFRAFFGLIIISPFIIKRGGIKAVYTHKIGIHLVRGVLAVMAMLSGFYAVTVLPLTLVTTLGFSRPLFMIPLAIFFLHEIVKARRWSATIIGFIGILIAIRPSGELEPAVFIALFSSFVFALVMITTKKLSSTEAPTTLMFYQGFLSSLFIAPLCLFYWITPSLYEFILLFMLAIFGSLSVNCTIRALKLADTTVVSPIEYIRIIFASFAGFVIFMEIPSIWTLVGGMVIIFSTVYIAYRESRLGYDKTFTDIN
ncbi:MAG: Riboflavin transporter [Alphaproteobacteria bacterium MarineAlpha2_Bin1]|nr:MAG: Riboflavin transporter [Alphaproteobacteria bacterium MarineAlpha2_Bin1]